jgi:hypothetical protein
MWSWKLFTQPCRHLLAACLSNVGALTSRNPIGLHGLEQGNLYFLPSCTGIDSCLWNLNCCDPYAVLNLRCPSSPPQSLIPPLSFPFSPVRPPIYISCVSVEAGLFFFKFSGNEKDKDCVQSVVSWAVCEMWAVSVRTHSRAYWDRSIKNMLCSGCVLQPHFNLSSGLKLRL